MPPADDPADSVVALDPKDTLTWHDHPLRAKGRVARHDRRTSQMKVEKMSLAGRPSALCHAELPL